MTANRDETVSIHAIDTEEEYRAGYPARVSVYNRDGAYHYAVALGLTDEPNGSKRAAGVAHSHQEGDGYESVEAAMAAGWRHIDVRWLGQKEVVGNPADMIKKLLHSLAYVGDDLESPVTWHCRGCEAVVSPEGRVEHTQYCAVGRAEQHIAADVSYGPPAGDAGQEEFFAG